MKRSCVVVVTALVAVSGLAAVTQTCGAALPARKGKIQNLWVEPSAPTSSSPVSVRVSITDPLRIDRVTVSKLSHRHIVNIYWSDPPAGAPANASLGQYTHEMGTLRAGQYAVFVQSFYKGMLIDFRPLLFQVR